MAQWTLDTLFTTLFIFVAYSGLCAVLLPYAFAPLPVNVITGNYIPVNYITPIYRPLSSGLLNTSYLPGNIVTCNALVSVPNFTTNASDCAQIYNTTSLNAYAANSLARNITTPLNQTAFSSNGFGALSQGNIILGGFAFMYAGFISFIKDSFLGIPLLFSIWGSLVSFLPSPINGFVGVFVGVFLSWGTVQLIFIGISLVNKTPVRDI